MLSHHLKNLIGQFWDDVICEQPLRDMIFEIQKTWATEELGWETEDLSEKTEDVE